MNLFLLQAEAPAGVGGFFASPYGTFVMMGLIILFFWLFFIRPQTKRQKELQRKREALGKGDKIVTAGGIHGEITEVKENYFLVEIDKNVQIRIEKTSVFVFGEELSK